LFTAVLNLFVYDIKIHKVTIKFEIKTTISPFKPYLLYNNKIIPNVHTTTLTQKEIGKLFNISHSVISNIFNNKIWSHVL
jgi:hypothetical protein